LIQEEEINDPSESGKEDKVKKKKKKEKKKKKKEENKKKRGSFLNWQFYTTNGAAGLESRGRPCVSRVPAALRS
jgi:hypothetical protein